VLPYYNASNPAQAYSGPNNLGTSQNTLRQDTVQLTLTAGVPATTGSQTTPATPVGQTALYTVTVAYGASTVVAGNIAKVAGAPFLTSNLLSLIQSVPTSGRLIGVQVFPGSGTYAPTSGMSTVVFEVQGGGGAGGGASGATSTNVTLGGPGVSGTYAKARYSAAQVGASQVITVGAGGTAVNGAAGGSGGSSSVGSLIVAPGGPGGTMLTNTAAPTVNSTGANSGAATGANIFSSLGSAASPSIAISSAVAASGAGGPSIFGPGGYSTGINSVGANAQNRCAGGGAAISNSSGGSLFGGNGGSGIVIAWEYA
jgi:hypothetical protein